MVAWWVILTSAAGRHIMASTHDMNAIQFCLWISLVKPLRRDDNSERAKLLVISKLLVVAIITYLVRLLHA